MDESILLLGLTSHARPKPLLASLLNRGRTCNTLTLGCAAERGWLIDQGLVTHSVLFADLLSGLAQIRCCTRRAGHRPTGELSL